MMIHLNGCDLPQANKEIIMKVSFTVVVYFRRTRSNAIFDDLDGGVGAKCTQWYISKGPKLVGRSNQYSYRSWRKALLTNEVALQMIVLRIGIYPKLENLALEDAAYVLFKVLDSDGDPLTNAPNYGEEYWFSTSSGNDKAYAYKYTNTEIQGRNSSLRVRAVRSF